ncbi:glycosyltransferase [Altererythrobacter salegens]|uniref:Glycosyltransferase n=1 Tax=Croceibacterium salegens TaxID=1737568 RepID=A0A6I4SXL3_9SPHN|nr:glycosyltransferase family 2 protein [Croceibacterium salegens]MXO60731.1 glycosyltransferase [Croceibacterium salegens]
MITCLGMPRNRAQKNRCWKYSQNKRVLIAIQKRLPLNWLRLLNAISIQAEMRGEFVNIISENTTKGHGGREEGGGQHPLLSVVIPAFNEERAVGATIVQLRDCLANAGIAHEIVVIDDGSTDETCTCAQSAGANVVRMPQNGGYGRALKAGIAVSEGALLAIIDADGTYPAERLPAMVELSRYNDMVVGDRGVAMQGVPLLRRPAKFMLNNVASLLAGHRISDLNSGLRVFQRPALERFLYLLPNGFSFTTTITMCMLASGHRVAYLPIVYAKRIGTSKIRATDFFRFMTLVFRLTVYFQPLRVFMPVAMLLFAIGIGKGIYDIFLDNLSETAVLGVLGGIMVWSLGMIADMIARMQLGPDRRGR